MRMVRRSQLDETFSRFCSISCSMAVSEETSKLLWDPFLTCLKSTLTDIVPGIEVS